MREPVPLWQELEARAKGSGPLRWLRQRAATHALRREAPCPELCMKAPGIDAQWRLRDREQVERQREREAGR